MLRDSVWVHQDWPWREDFLSGVWVCFRCTEVPILESRTAIPHEKLHTKFPSWLQEGRFLYQAPAHWTPWALEVAQLKRGNERLGRGSCWIPKSTLKVARFLPQDLRYWSVFPIFWNMFPCQKGFRHATGIGKYGWFLILMVFCLVHSFLLFSIYLFYFFYSQTILCLSVDGLPRTEDCEFEESLLGATWEFFV